MEKYMPVISIFIEFLFVIVVGLIAYVIRELKSDLDQVKKDAIAPALCLKNHELDTLRTENISKLIVRVEDQSKNDHRETRGKLEELAKNVDTLKLTVLKVGHLRRRTD